MKGGVIDNLGIENVETIKKDALIAKAKAERERKEVEAEQDKLANDKRVAADLEIAQKKTKRIETQTSSPSSKKQILPKQKQMPLKGLRQKCNVVNKSAWQPKPIS